MLNKILEQSPFAKTTILYVRAKRCNAHPAFISMLASRLETLAKEALDKYSKYG